MEIRNVITKLIGKDDIFKILALGEATKLPVLLLGEPGTGKSSVTRVLSVPVDPGCIFQMPWGSSKPFSKADHKKHVFAEWFTQYLWSRGALAIIEFSQSSSRGSVFYMFCLLCFFCVFPRVSHFSCKR